MESHTGGAEAKICHMQAVVTKNDLIYGLKQATEKFQPEKYGLYLLRNSVALKKEDIYL